MAVGWSRMLQAHTSNHKHKTEHTLGMAAGFGVLVTASNKATPKPPQAVLPAEDQGFKCLRLGPSRSY